MENFWSEVLPTWLTAIGTCGAVGYSLFSSKFRRWYNKPKISISCDFKNDQCVEYKKSESTSSNVDEAIYVRIKLENNGRWSAKDSTIIIDCYYHRLRDDKYEKKDFFPVELKDFNGKIQRQIVPKMAYYYEVVSIHKEDKMVSSEDKSNTTQFYKLFLFQEKVLSKGKYIIPLKFYARDIFEIAYLEITLDNDQNPKKNLEDMNVKILEECEFEKLQITNK